MEAFKIKIRAYFIGTKHFESLNDDLRPDVIIYSGPAAVDVTKYGVSTKKYHKAISKRITGALIPDDLHIMIWIKFNKQMFETTHALGTEGEHTVFHEDQFKRSLLNFKEFALKS